VLTGSQDDTVKLWDAQTGKEILSLAGHTQEVTSVAFSPDGRLALSSSRDGTAIVWLTVDWRTETGIRTASAE
jgi:WD40 repeat protein